MSSQMRADNASFSPALPRPPRSGHSESARSPQSSGCIIAIARLPCAKTAAWALLSLSPSFVPHVVHARLEAHAMRAFRGVNLAACGPNVPRHYGLRASLSLFCSLHFPAWRAFLKRHDKDFSRRDRNRGAIFHIACTSKLQRHR